jgi:tetratricopeptide (TPR) repeat protein
MNLLEQLLNAKASDLNEKPGLKVMLLNRLGIMYTYMSQYTQGFQQLEKARKFSLDQRLPLDAAGILCNIGIGYRHQLIFDKALQILELAKNEYEEIGTEDAMAKAADCRRHIGSAKISMGYSEDTLEYSEETLE